MRILATEHLAAQTADKASPSASEFWRGIAAEIRLSMLGTVVIGIASAGLLRHF